MIAQAATALDTGDGFSFNSLCYYISKKFPVIIEQIKSSVEEHFIEVGHDTLLMRVSGHGIKGRFKLNAEKTNKK